jgi:nucleoside-diphosphate-sugar epimerase
MKVLVTGGSGFLGGYVCEALAANGHVVRALVRRSSKRDVLLALSSLEFAEGSVEDTASVERAMEGVDAVIHCAGLVKAKTAADFFTTNVGGTKNVLEAAKKNAATVRRFVFVSSQAAIGPSEDGSPVPPDREPHPVTQYGRSKLEAERLVIAAKGDLHVVVIRPPLVYGPRDLETLEFFQWVSRGVRLSYGDGTNTLSIVYAADAADACVRALEADVPSGSAYFVNDGEIHVWRDFIGEIERGVGKKTFVRFGIPLPVVKAYAALSEGYGKLTDKAVMVTRDKFNELAQKHWVCDASSARRELGWASKTTMRDGIAAAAVWYRNHGLL